MEKQYSESLIRTAVFDVESLHNIRALQMTMEFLCRKVGAPISSASIARDVGVSPSTLIRNILIPKWLVYHFSRYSYFSFDCRIDTEKIKDLFL